MLSLQSLQMLRSSESILAVTRMQCKGLTVWSVYFKFTLIHFLAKSVFSRGYGGVQNRVEGLLVVKK